VLSRIRRELPVKRLAVFDADMAPVGGDELEAPLEPHGTYGGYVAEACPGSHPSDGSREACHDVYVVVQARARTGELYGFFVADVDLAFVGEALIAARLGEGARLWVVDSRGRPVASSEGRTDARPSSRAVEAAAASATEGSLETGGVLAVYRNLATFQTHRGVSWVIVLEQPTREAFALARATTRDTLVVGAGVLFIALVLGSLLASRITRPLRDLAAHVENVGAARNAPSLTAGTLSAPGEIGLLARRFEDMERRVAERVRLQAELARSQQLASVGALAAGVAHEVNNPLTTILGYASLLLEDKAETHPDRQPLTLIADEARRVQGIVRTLLDHARQETNSQVREPLDVNPIVERCVKLLQPTLKKRGISLEVSLGRELPQASLNQLRMEQVFVNLGQNAAQAMDRGGSLAIRTSALDGGQGVKVEFEDTGPGIPDAQLGQIFEPFFTTKGPGVGTGLGLAICRQIVLDHGGRIEVESSVGKGSIFRVVLESGPRAGVPKR
jgi:signal transduction histidine kinase